MTTDHKIGSKRLLTALFNYGSICPVKESRLSVQVSW